MFKIITNIPHWFYINPAFTFMTVDNYIKLHLTITISSFFTQKGGIAQLNFQCKTNNLQYQHVHQDDYLNDRT